MNEWHAVLDGPIQVIALVLGTLLSVLTTLWLMRRFMPGDAANVDERRPRP